MSHGSAASAWGMFARPFGAALRRPDAFASQEVQLIWTA